MTDVTIFNDEPTSGHVDWVGEVCDTWLLGAARAAGMKVIPGDPDRKRAANNGDNLLREKPVVQKSASAIEKTRLLIAVNRQQVKLKRGAGISVHLRLTAVQGALEVLR